MRSHSRCDGDEHRRSSSRGSNHGMAGSPGGPETRGGTRREPVLVLFTGSIAVLSNRYWSSQQVLLVLTKVPTLALVLVLVLVLLSLVLGQLGLQCPALCPRELLDFYPPLLPPPPSPCVDICFGEGGGPVGGGA